jgi:hypothetical protein
MHSLQGNQAAYGIATRDPGGRPAPTVADAVASIGSELNPRLGQISEDIHFRLSTEIDLLAGDERLVQLLFASIEGNVDSILHTFQHEIDISRIEAPAAAVEYACRLAQRGVPANKLVRAYRLGQDSFLRLSLEELERQSPGTTQFASAAAQQLVAVVSAYIDRVTERVVTVYEEERDRWLLNRNTARIGRIKELLDGRNVDIESAENILGYRLRQFHLGLIVWAPRQASQGDELAQMERVGGLFAEQVGCRERPLFVPCDELSSWVWLPLGRAEEIDKAALVHAAQRDEPQIRVSAGAPAFGVDGFRRSHQQAVQAYTVAAAARGYVSETVDYNEVGAVALMCSNIDETRSWVADVLGELAHDDEPRERLRDTMRAFLASGSSYTMAASKLGMHKNTVQYRLRKAEEELGKQIRDHRRDLEIALEICHWLGPTVLLDPQRTGYRTY